MVITCEKDGSMDDQVRGYRGIRALLTVHELRELNEWHPHSEKKRECGCSTVNYQLFSINY